jgi:hypothetical protein
MDAGTSLAGVQIGSTIMAVGGIQYFKNAKWFTWLKADQKKAARAWSLISAAGISLGIRTTFTGSLVGGSDVLVHIPGIWLILRGLFHWAQQFAFQEFGYTGLQAANALIAILGHLQTLPSFGQPEPAPKPVPEPAGKL